MKMQSFEIILALSILVGCVLKEESPIASYNNSANLLQSGDILVVNTPNDAIVHLDSNGNYKSTLVQENDAASVIIGGLNYDSVNKRILYTYDHATAALDAVKSIDLYNGRVETVLNNNNLSGTLANLVRLTGGDYIIFESATTVEKFNSAFVRVGTPFTPAPAMATANVQIEAMSDGGFLICTTSTAALSTVKTYSAAGAAAFSATSALPAPSLGALPASGCKQRADGTIVVAYSGAIDTIRAYSSNLGTILWDYSDLNVLSSPGRISARSNGNILITDTVFNHIVELTSDGAFLRIIGGAVLSTPGSVQVIP